MMTIVSPLIALVVALALSGPTTGQDPMAEAWEDSVNRTQPPDRVLDAIGLKAGMSVGEVGAGRGRYTVHLARRVGPRGAVYANDIDPAALAYLARRCESNGLGNVRTVAGDVHAPRFPAGSLDMVFMINVYNSFVDPVRYLRNIAPTLKPEGVLAIVLVDPVKFPVVPKHSATREQFLASARQAGYVLEREETFLVHDGIYVLRHPQPQGAGRLAASAGPRKEERP